VPSLGGFYTLQRVVPRDIAGVWMNFWGRLDTGAKFSLVGGAIIS